MSEHTTLYRLYDQSGALLYVGIAGNPGRRFEQHRGDKPWWGEVTDMKVEHFETRREAIIAEITAIQIGRPVYNKTHTGMTKAERNQIARQVKKDGLLDQRCSICTELWGHFRYYKPKRVFITADTQEVYARFECINKHIWARVEPLDDAIV